jgi:aarF domain-containing kinase
VVVIKVKHPGVSESIQRDFGIMMWVASQLEWLAVFRKLHLKESLQQFAVPLREQVRVPQHVCF